jgi:hypothetical protein
MMLFKIIELLVTVALKQARQERQEQLRNRNQLYRSFYADQVDKPLLDDYDSLNEITKRRYLKSKRALND